MKNSKFLIFIILIISAIVFVQLRASRYEKKLSKNGILTVGKIESFDVMPKFTNIYVSYYVNKVKLITPVRKLNNKINEDNIGDFYEVKYLKETPEVSRTNFEKQITDTNLILKAGFSKKNIILINK